VKIAYGNMFLETYPVRNVSGIYFSCYILHPNRSTAGYGRGEDEREAVQTAVREAIRGNVFNQIEADIIAEMVNRTQLFKDPCIITLGKKDCFTI
jgi:hypothetical protein